jgi:SAM-dependent methyltransferase
VDLLSEFRRRHNRNIVPRYESRETRNKWAATLLRDIPGTHVLNLGGGGKRHLGTHLGPPRVVHELDITGDCDTRLNLDEIDALPFQNGAFDICCAFDVLEHLEQFHLVAQEIFRVAKSTVLISLPNSAAEILPICRNMRSFNDPLENGVYSKFNGLPVAPPTDRHRWWLTFEDIVRFFVSFEQANSCVVEFYVPEDFSFKRRLLRLIGGERLYMTLCCSSVWIRIQK